MFLRPTFVRKNGRRYAYWRLVESYRTERGPRQRTVAYLGQMDEAGRLGVHHAIEPQPTSRQQSLFTDSETKPEFIEIDRTRVRVENCLKFGGPWLALELVKRLGLHEFLKREMPVRKEDVPWSLTSLILVVARLCEPSSELQIAEHFYRQSALCDLLGVPVAKVDDNRLYRGLDELLPLKEKMEVFLKEHVETMERRYGKAQRIWVMDRGMVSQENLEFLKSGDRRYIIGTPKSQLKRFQQSLLSQDWHELRDGLEVKLCACPEGGTETFILCRSRDRREKERAMHARFEKRIEEGLTKIAASCAKSRQDVAKIAERVGRLRGQNTRAAGLFDVPVSADKSGAAQITWTKVEKWRTWAQLSEGAYVLRSNVNNWTDEELWRAYIQLTEAEAAFCIQKSDLSLRPVWHQKEDRVLAHILVCFLAYVLWKFLGQLCMKAGLGDEPRRVLKELSELRTVDVILTAKDGREIRTRCITQPTDHQKILLQHLGWELPKSLRPIQM